MRRSHVNIMFVACVWVLLVAWLTTASSVDPFGCSLQGTAASCDALSPCTWSGDACLTECGYAQKLTGVCESAQCMWDTERQHCVPSCLALSGYNESLCASIISQCTWNPLTRQCDFRCVTAAVESTCMALPSCVWNTRLYSSCQPSCYYRYSMEQTCNADAYCIWNPVALYCQPACSEYGQSAVLCIGSSVCTWDPETSACSLSNCSSNSDARSCSAAYGCTWEPPLANNSSCVQGCVFAYRNEADCDASSGGTCSWDAALQACAPACPTYSSEMACSATTRCMWNVAQAICEPSCMSARTEGSCASLGSPCRWTAVSSPQCQPYCSNQTLISCGSLSQVCTTRDGMCTPSCSALYDQSTHCNVDPYCNWNSTAAVCAPSCAALDSNESCVQDSQCAWIPAQRRCALACTILLDAASCESTMACMWTAPLQECIQSCDVITDPLSCNSVTLCSWNLESGQCQTACASLYYQDRFACSADARCEFNTALNLCQQKCGFINEEGLCNRTSTCAWYSGSLCGTSLASVEIGGGTFAAQMNTSRFEPSLLVGVQADLNNAYGGSVASVVAAGIRIAATSVRIPFVSPDPQLPPTISSSVGVASPSWLQATSAAYRANGGTGSLVVESANGPSPAGPPATIAPQVMPQDQLVITIIVALAVLTVLLLGVIWVWRRNPYAAIRPTMASVIAVKFPDDEIHRLRIINERMLNYAEARALRVSRRDTTESAAWPVVARCSVPKNQQRKPAQREAWDEMCTTLFPSIFDYFSGGIPVGIDDVGRIRAPPYCAIDIVRFSQALRIRAHGMETIEFMMIGLPRLGFFDESGLLMDPTITSSMLDPAVDLFLAVRSVFEHGGHCSRFGTYEARKTVFGELHQIESEPVEKAIDAPSLRSARTLIGIPPTWTMPTVLTALRAMLQVAAKVMSHHKDLSSNPIWLQRTTYFGRPSWRVRTLDPVAEIALFTVANRFWAMEESVLCCCSSTGIVITAEPFVAHWTRSHVALPVGERSPPSSQPAEPAGPSAEVSDIASLSEVEMHLIPDDE